MKIGKGEWLEIIQIEVVFCISQLEVTTLFHDVRLKSMSRVVEGRFSITDNISSGPTPISSHDIHIVLVIVHAKCSAQSFDDGSICAMALFPSGPIFVSDCQLSPSQDTQALRTV